MITPLKSILYAFAAAVFVSCASPSESIPKLKDGVLDQSDTLTLGLPQIPGLVRITVFAPGGPFGTDRPDSADPTIGTDRPFSAAAPVGTYINNVLLTHFGGRYYCMWQRSERDEDTPDTRVEYAVSSGGRLWSSPRILALPTDSTFVSPGGWIQRGDSLAAVLNYVCSADRAKGGTAWYSVTKDGSTWTTPAPVTMADGSPVDGIFEQDPMVVPGKGSCGGMPDRVGHDGGALGHDGSIVGRDGRTVIPGLTGNLGHDGLRTVGAVHFRPGLTVGPVYTDDPSALSGWRRASFPEGEGKPLEPSQFRAPDGTLVMLFRDQASSFVKLASVSVDGGLSWTAPVRTNIPDARTKQCAGTLPDGRPFWVGCPTGNKSRRILVLAVASDGCLFDRAWMIAGPTDLPPRRFPGRYKTLGYNYPKATVIDGILWMSLSVNKEEAVLFRVPLEGV